VTIDRVDIVIVGAGLSGIGTACHLRDKCPDKTFAILESRGSIGGTWDLFRYPGIRSDSDMHTLGYEFKPWIDEKSIADGLAILDYVKEAATEHGIDQHIRFNQRVTKTSWSGEDAMWTVETTSDQPAGAQTIQCNFLLMCAGYYSYSNPNDPIFAGRDSFEGDIVHPQFWPSKLDHEGKRIVVIGSGATAVTLVPALAESATHVTMLQRSPSYVVSMPAKDIIANILRKILPTKIAYALTRWKNIAYQQLVYGRTRVQPDKIKDKIVGLVSKELGDDYDVQKHFTPRYDPWDQRLCLVPDGDLFAAIRSGAASVVTDEIERFTTNGIQLKSGDHVPADIIVTATGLNLCVLGDVEFVVDGQAVNVSDTFSYKSMMFSDVPNMISTFGYINASWTLRADIIANYTCRLINHMTTTDTRQCTARVSDEYRDMPGKPWIENFSSGYMQRSMHLLPKQGDRHPWLNTQNFTNDQKMIRDQGIPDDVLEFLA
jgi:monooxygenase